MLGLTGPAKLFVKDAGGLKGYPCNAFGGLWWFPFHAIFCMTIAYNTQQLSMSELEIAFIVHCCS